MVPLEWPTDASYSSDDPILRFKYLIMHSSPTPVSMIGYNHSIYADRRPSTLITNKNRKKKKVHQRIIPMTSDETKTLMPPCGTPFVYNHAHYALPLPYESATEPSSCLGLQDGNTIKAMR